MGVETNIYNYCVNLLLKVLYYISTNIINLRLWYVRGQHIVKLIHENEYNIGEREFTVYQYVFIVDGKSTYINTIGLDTDETTALDTTALETIKDNRNMIVYCCLRSPSNEFDIDVTDEFRKFAYYYKDEDEKCKFKYAIKHIFSNVLGEDYENYDVHIFVNDDDFTEKVYKIEDANEVCIKRLIGRDSESQLVM